MFEKMKKGKQKVECNNNENKKKQDVTFKKGVKLIKKQTTDKIIKLMKNLIRKKSKKI